MPPQEAIQEGRLGHCCERDSRTAFLASSLDPAYFSSFQDWDLTFSYSRVELFQMLRSLITPEKEIL